jgi:hypothetical protein
VAASRRSGGRKADVAGRHARTRPHRPCQRAGQRRDGEDGDDRPGHAEAVLADEAGEVGDEWDGERDQLDERRGAPEARSRSGARERGGGEGEADDDEHDEHDREGARWPGSEQGPHVVGGPLPPRPASGRAAGRAHRGPFMAPAGRAPRAEHGRAPRRGASRSPAARSCPLWASPGFDARSGHRPPPSAAPGPRGAVGRRRAPGPGRGRPARGARARSSSVVASGPAGVVGRGSPRGRTGGRRPPVEVAQLHDDHVGVGAAVERGRARRRVESQAERARRSRTSSSGPTLPRGRHRCRRPLRAPPRRCAWRSSTSSSKVCLRSSLPMTAPAGRPRRGPSPGTGLGAVQERFVDARDGRAPRGGRRRRRPPAGRWRRASTAAAGSRRPPRRRRRHRPPGWGVAGHPSRCRRRWGRTPGRPSSRHPWGARWPRPPPTGPAGR